MEGLPTVDQMFRVNVRTGAAGSLVRHLPDEKPPPMLGTHAQAAATALLLEEPPIDTAVDRPVGTVLVVDDTLALRRVVRRILEMNGFVVVEAEGGEEALAAIESQAFDAVLLDFHLHGHRGDSVYHAACELRPDLGGRIVLISGDPAAAECYPARVEHCPVVAKPFAPQELMGAVRRVVRQ